MKLKKEFLSNIANYCLNLKELEVLLVENSQFGIPFNIVVILIQKQNNLEKFIIARYPLNDIIYIQFSYIDFSNNSFKNFINLSNLNYLLFRECKDTNPLDRYEILKFASFKLKKIKIYFKHLE
jgi:hypothetical protein